MLLGNETRGQGIKRWEGPWGMGEAEWKGEHEGESRRNRVGGRRRNKMMEHVVGLQL